MRYALIAAALLTLSACATPEQQEEWAEQRAMQQGKADVLNATLTQADIADCNYRAAAAAAGVEGSLMQAATQGQVRQLCLRAKAEAHIAAEAGN